MMAPDWLGRAMRDAFPPRNGKKMRKIAAIADRIDARTDDMATAITAISEKLRA
jgi:hypothetical protein